MNATDQAILAAYQRRLDPDGYSAPDVERQVAGALGLSTGRVAFALDRAGVIRKGGVNRSRYPTAYR